MKKKVFFSFQCSFQLSEFLKEREHERQINLEHNFIIFLIFGCSFDDVDHCDLLESVGVIVEGPPGSVLVILSKSRRRGRGRRRLFHICL